MELDTENVISCRFLFVTMDGVHAVKEQVVPLELESVDYVS
jgi:hypothetical protein